MRPERKLFRQGDDNDSTKTRTYDFEYRGRHCKAGSETTKDLDRTTIPGPAVAGSFDPRAGT